MSKLTKKERRNAGWRWSFIGSNNINYGTLQATGYAWAVAKTLRKLYPNDEEYKQAMRVEYEYFNITPYMGPFVVGADIALQEQKGVESLDAVRSLKTSLMGPLSGIGDSLLWVLFPTIMGSISGYMALQGNPLGAVIWILINLLLVWMRIKLFDLGYESGSKLLVEMGDKINALTESASVLGLTVVGSLIATVIKIQTPVTLNIGEVSMNIQTEILDRIFPGLLAVVLTLLVYWLLEKKKVGFLKVVLILVALSLVLSYFGVLGL